MSDQPPAKPEDTSPNLAVNDDPNWNYDRDWSDDDFRVFREDGGSLDELDDPDKFIDREMDRLFQEDMEAELYPNGRPSRDQMRRMELAAQMNHDASTTNLGDLFKEALLKKNKGTK